MEFLKEVVEKNLKAVLYGGLVYGLLMLLFYLFGQYVYPLLLLILIPILPLIGGYIAVHLSKNKKLYVAEITGLLSGLIGAILFTVIYVFIFLSQGFELSLMPFLTSTFTTIVLSLIFSTIGGSISRWHNVKVKLKKRKLKQKKLNINLTVIIWLIITPILYYLIWDIVWLVGKSFLEPIYFFPINVIIFIGLFVLIGKVLEHLLKTYAKGLSEKIGIMVLTKKVKKPIKKLAIIKILKWVIITVLVVVILYVLYAFFFGWGVLT
jgi:hypothetical protein